MPRIKFSPELLDKICTNQYTEKALDLSIQPLSDENIAELVAVLEMNTHIKSLLVCACKIGPRGVQILAANTTLTTLDVSCNKIGPEGAKVLANMKLTALDVSTNGIGSEGVRDLAANRTLRTLNVSFNGIGPEGVQALAANRTLTTLNVSQNEIGPEGALAFLSNPTLTTLTTGEAYDATIGEQLDTMLAQNRKRAEAATDLAVLVAAARAVKETELQEIGSSMLPLTDIIRGFAGFTTPTAHAQSVGRFMETPFCASLVAEEREEEKEEVVEKVRSRCAIS